MTAITTLIGTRPEIIKMAVLIGVLDKNFEHELIFTNQHFDRNMADVFFEELKIRKPDHYLQVKSSDLTALESSIAVQLKKSSSDQVIVFGDTNSCLGATRAAKKLNKKLIHIEAGARSFDLGMPEEVSRIETDRLSDVLFAHSEACAKNLQFEKVKGKIIVSGNPGVDTVLKYSKISGSKQPYRKYGLSKGGFIIMTLHRASNTDSPAHLVGFLDLLGKLECDFLFPVHPRTSKVLQSIGYIPPKNIHMCEPMGYLDFLSCLQDSMAIVTDSGGIQLEAVTLGIPCLVARTSTEYWEGLYSGIIKLVGLDDRLLLFNLKLLSRMPIQKTKKNPYGDGKASESIANHLVHATR